METQNHNERNKLHTNGGKSETYRKNILNFQFHSHLDPLKHHNKY